MIWLLVTFVGVSFASGIGYVIRRDLKRLDEQRHAQHLPELAGDTFDGAAVRIEGVVRPIESLTAPLSGKVCVAYRTLCWAHGDPVRGPQALEGTALFVVEREGASPVVVDGSHARLGGVPPLPREEHVGAREARFLEVHGVRSTPRSAQFREQIVKAGDRVIVAGEVLREGADPVAFPSASEHGYRDIVTTVRLAGTYEKPLIIALAARAR